ncbi:MAG: HAD family hydrolase [Clostridia bacterium]|nr:HAD family hydrolase [Clostridia bacterium]
MIKAVVFDLDGTLVNSIDDLADSSNAALMELGFPTHEVEKYRYFIGDGMRKLIERILPQEKRYDEMIETCHKIFRRIYDENYLNKTAAYEGIYEMLDSLKEKGYKLAVISNKVDVMAKKIVSELFGSVFDFVSGKVDNLPTKPDPTLTLSIMKEMGVEPNECAFVGDSGMDMLTAVNTGALPIGVSWGFRGREELLENGAQYIIDAPLHIMDVLEKENAEL